MQTVTLYTTNYCGFCIQAKTLLKNLDIPFEEIDLGDNEKLRDELSLKHSWRTVPMIFIGDRFIGGFDDLRALHQKGELKALLQKNT